MARSTPRNNTNRAKRQARRLEAQDMTPTQVYRHEKALAEQRYAERGSTPPESSGRRPIVWQIVRVA